MLALWWALPLLVLAWALHEAFDLGGAGAHTFFRAWVNGAVLWGAAALCAAGALNEERGRLAWLLIAVAIACWALGDTIWTVRFEDAQDVPVTSISDVFSLAWYPLVIVALALLVRDRVPRFELHRWIDGVIVTLFVATPWVALFLQPTFDHTTASSLGKAVEVAYVLGDAILVGAVVGVGALMAWRPGRMWLLLGTGLGVLAISDAAYSTQVLQHAYHAGGGFDVAWAAGTLLIAVAAWQPHPGHVHQPPAFGWRAIALPVAAQLLAIAIQLYGYFDELPNSERVLTIVVLLIATVQITIARPRAPG